MDHGRRLPGFEVPGAWQPAHTVSGDYYDVLRLSDHKLGICAADVAGKGVSAAPLTANVQAAVRAYAGVAMSPAEVCTRGNSLLHEILLPESSSPFSTEFSAARNGLSSIATQTIFT